jgi:rhamnose utilization protein RhaD (predicted bifunctional aldolase and dehydrogenase)
VREQSFASSGAELKPLLDLTERVGGNPLLAQASTGNISEKRDGVLWIKASGKWMADARRDDIFLRLDLGAIREYMRQGVNPAERFPDASVETAMHAALPHRVVLHVHCINTIAWAVRGDAPLQLEYRLHGLNWQWIPYVLSGLPLSRAIEDTLAAYPSTNVFVLGNHGLVVAGEDAVIVEVLLREVTERLAILPRPAPPADVAALVELSRDSTWDLPDDDRLHALGTDAVSQTILSAGLLYPCQAIFSDTRTPDLFRSTPYADLGDDWKDRYENRPLLIIDGRGVIVRRSIKPAELAMLSGLAQVVQRLDRSAPLRYLTAAEVAGISRQGLYGYRERASQGR